MPSLAKPARGSGKLERIARKTAKAGITARLRRRKDLQKRKTKREIREQVLEMDGWCRWPECGCVGDDGFELECCHFKAEGMGGDPTLTRYTPENLIILCKYRHRTAAQNLHNGRAKMRPLTEAGMRGPVEFLALSVGEFPRWYSTGVTVPPAENA